MTRIWNKHKQTNTPLKRKVFVAMSGGVDSSVAAALLQDQGFIVMGVHIKCYNVDGCGERDAEDARRVAEQLNIPFYVFDFEKEYKDRVVQYMIDGYKNGITPNPDVMCNREIKFGLFLEKALLLGADYVATGHYVKMKSEKQKAKNKKYALFQAKDRNKDQSYFLWMLTQEQIKHCLFPLGDYIKPQVRKLAKRYGLLTATKKDSQGICFLGQVSMADFLKKYIPEKYGNVLDLKGNIIGTHKGVHLYTIGQRHGFTVGRLKVKGESLPAGRHGLKTEDQKPRYIIAKDIKSNTITVADKELKSNFLVKEIKLEQVNFINRKPLTFNLSPVFVRTRYRQLLVKAFLICNHKPLTFNLCFLKPQKYIAAGQSAVFYSKKGEMLGGGVIV